MLVYLIHNIVNSKLYVGWTRTSFAERWQMHIDHALEGKDWAFSRAIRLHGPNAFSHEILAVVKTRQEATHLEKIWILMLRSFDPEVGYNMTYGGEGGRPTEEVRKKISEKIKALRQIPWNKGKPRSLETRQRISATKKGTKMSVDWCKNQSERMLGQPSRNKGKKISEETRKRMQAASKLSWINRKSAGGANALQ